MKKFASIILFMILTSNIFGQTNYYEIPDQVKVLAGKSEEDLSMTNYVFSKNKTKYKICVSLPNLKDKFWWSASYGLFLAEKKLNIDLAVYDAGGYDQFEAEKNNINDCLKKNPDAFIIAGTNAKNIDDTLSIISKQNIPIIELANGLESKYFRANVHMPFAHLLKLTTDRIQQIYPKNKTKKNILWFPGPKDATWADLMDKYFRKFIPIQQFNIIEGGRKTTDKGEQRGLLESAVRDHKFDFMAGNAVLAYDACQIYKRQTDAPKIFSTYFNYDIEECIRGGNIDSAPSEFVIIQSVLAVDTAIKILKGRPFSPLVSAIGKLYDKQNIDQIYKDFASAPNDFRFYLKKNF